MLLLDRAVMKRSASVREASPTIAEIRNSTTATKKMIFAISIESPAIPPNPRTAAISATIRKVKAQPSMVRSPRLLCGAWAAFARFNGGSGVKVPRSVRVRNSSARCGIEQRRRIRARRKEFRYGAGTQQGESRICYGSRRADVEQILRLKGRRSIEQARTLVRVVFASRLRHRALDGQADRVPHRFGRGDHLGGNRAAVRLQRHVAAGHQYLDHDRDLPDGVPDSEHPEPRHHGVAAQAVRTHPGDRRGGEPLRHRRGFVGRGA